MSALVDAYVRENRIALQIFDDRGHSEFHGVSKRTIDAFVRRGLAWYDHNLTGGLTPRGRAALAELEAADQEPDGSHGAVSSRTPTVVA